MAVILTGAQTVGNVVKWISDPSTGFNYEVVTVNLAAGATLACGTVLAKVAATGKYLVQDASLASGAGLDNCVVLIGDDENTAGSTFATATDKKVLVLARDAIVADEKLVYGAGTDTAAEKLAVKADLAKVGIVVSTQL